tara:strand:+ start:1736 stop:1960 length:225 start_codon:yes stop_codon:yes gene_type:complete
MREAAREGARAALSEVGLNDEEAGQDVRELRNLIESWRSSKKIIGSTVLKMITTGVLIFIAAAVAMKMGIGSGD